MEISLSAKTDGRIGDSRFLSVLTESLLIWCGWLLQAALITKGKVWLMVPAGCLPDTESHVQSHCFPPSSRHASQQGCSQSRGIAWTLGSGAMLLFCGEKLALSTSLPPLSVLLFSPFSSCVCNTVRRLQPRACQTEQSRQQAVFLRTNFSVLYLACEWQLGALARCTGTLCLIRPSLLPSLIKIGWETLLGLESAQPL